MWPSNSTAQISNALNMNQQIGFVNGVKDALRDDYNMLKWATTHLSDVGRALVTNFENNLGSYLDRNVFENKLQKDNDLVAQRATNLLHDVENGNYYSAGRATEALAIAFLPISLGKGATLFAAKMMKEIEIVGSGANFIARSMLVDYDCSSS